MLAASRPLDQLDHITYAAGMAAYNIYEAKTSFSALVEKAVNGEEIIIAKAGKPVLKLVPLPEKPANSPESVYRRPPPGFLKVDVSDLLKALDEPWDEEEQRAFGMID